MSKQSSSKNTYDVIVLGIGSMGSAACYYLADAGVKVLGLEQFTISHENGSHTGQSRIIRQAYFEHSDYVPLLQRAYQNWTDVENDSNAKIYHKTGLLYLAKQNHPLISGVQFAAEKYDIPIEKISTEEMQSKFPQFSLPTKYKILYEPDAGFVTPEIAIATMAKLAIQKGAQIHTDEKIVQWNKNENIYQVQTNKGTYHCAKLVITGGAWASNLLPILQPHIKVTRQVLAWLQPKNNIDFALGTFPCWTCEDESKSSFFYGFPILPTEFNGGTVGMKIGHHAHGLVTDPDLPQEQSTKKEVEHIMDFVETYMPEVKPTVTSVKTCFYTNTPDEHFIIDYHPDYNTDVIFASGFSGHGFKFASVVGEILADLALQGKTDQPIEFLSLSRFSI